MSSGLNKYTENLVYRANIFNYDSKFFDEFSKGSQLYDRLGLRDNSFDKASKKLSDLDRFFGYQIVKQFDELNSLANLLHETDSSSDEVKPNINLNSNNERKSATSKDAKLVVETLIEILSCSFIVLQKNEKERIDTHHKSEVGDYNEKKQYSEKIIGNITFCLLYLDGILMYNIDLAGVFELMSLNVGVRFNKLLSDLLYSNLIPDTSKEVASHILSASVVFSVNTRHVTDEFNDIIEWSYNYNTLNNKSKDNSFTSNMVLLLSNESGLESFVENFKHKRILNELFEILEKEYSVNTTYESLICVWNISNSDRYKNIFEDRSNNCLEKVIRIIKTNKVEKIIRIGSLIIKVSLINIILTQFIII